MVFYHGSNHKINSFSDEFVGNGIDQEGPGIYFTSSENEAAGYGEYLYRVDLNPNKLVSTKPGITPKKEIEFLMKKAPNLEDTLYNWGENKNQAYAAAFKAMTDSGESPHEVFQSIWYDFYRKNPIEYVRNMIKLRYDGVLVDKAYNNVKHLVVFNPDIISNIETISQPTISESYKKRLVELAGITSNINDNFHNWFKNSKVVDSSGNPMIVHHGAGSKFSKFSLKNAPQPIIWFTNNKSSIKAGESGAQGRSHIMDLYVSLQNPAGWKEYEKYGLGQLEEMGYDGAILPEGSEISGFVFKPNQLKAVSNKGEWDINNNNIYK